MNFGPNSGIENGDNFVYYQPLDGRFSDSRRLVIFFHGSGGNATQAVPSATSSDPGNVYTTIRELVRRGYVVASFDFLSTTNWGDPASITQMATNLGWCSNLGAKTTKVALLCYSMGHITAANWARTNVAKVAAIVGAAPSTDTQYHYDNGFSAAIDAAYSGSWATNGGDNFNPIKYTATLNAIPWLGYSGSADTTVPAGDVSGGVLRYANTYGAKASVIATAESHATIWNSVNPMVIADFIDAGLW